MILNQHVTITSLFIFFNNVDLASRDNKKVGSDYFPFFLFSFPDGSTHHKCGFLFVCLCIFIHFKYYKNNNMID